MREMLRMILVLSSICAVAGLTLASVKQATAPRIELQVLTHVKGPALATVFAEYDNDPIRERRRVSLADGSEKTVFPARLGGELRSVAFEYDSGGYGGPIGVMVGFDMETGDLTGIGITTHRETPGVGSRVALPSFTNQFRGHGAEDLALKGGGGDIDAVSGATISSSGVARAASEAARSFDASREAIKRAFANDTSDGEG